jgi:methylisocitrate lyase
LSTTPGARFKAAVTAEQPLQVVGTINANHALLAKRAGYLAIYLSGGGVAAGSLGIPDLGITTLADVVTDAQRITSVCDLPLLVDIDTGFGASAFNIERTIKTLERAGVAAVHLEDQVSAKRCGHRPNKARSDQDFVVMARTDSIAIEGTQSALERIHAYVEAGADMVFPEAIRDLETFKNFAAAAGVPVLANITEFGMTPLFTVEELRDTGVGVVLYPLSAFRAMNKAAENVYEVIRREGSQKSVIDSMQTREELYDRIDYYRYEKELDQLFGKNE